MNPFPSSMILSQIRLFVSYFLEIKGYLFTELRNSILNLVDQVLMLYLLILLFLQSNYKMFLLINVFV